MMTKVIVTGISAFGIFSAAASAKSSIAADGTRNHELALMGFFHLDEDRDDDGYLDTRKSLTVAGSYLWKIGCIGVGPEVSYAGSWSKSKYSSTREASTYHYWLLGVGVRAKVDFVDSESATIVPYAAAGIQYLQGQNDLSEKEKTTGDDAYLGLGLSFPVGQVAAINIETVYDWRHTKDKYDASEGDSGESDGVSVGVSRTIKTSVGFSLYL